jgi:hypothetical protein
MTDCGLQKCFGDVSKLLAHPFFRETGLRDDLSAGKVFPAIRNEEVHFYHGGGRLCVYKNGRMYTNNRYLGIEDHGQSQDIRIPEDRFNATGYEAIKRICEDWREPERELRIISELFPAFSIAACHVPSDRAYLLDIECRFPGTAKAGHAEPVTKQDMIDCLFLTPGRTLVFVEVKTTGAPAARGSGKSEPAVAGQLRRYEERFRSGDLCKKIVDVYVGVTATLGEILGRHLPVPQTVFERVPLLIAGSASKPSPHAKEVWQRDLLASPLSFDMEVVGIDGRDGRMNAALNEFFSTLDSKIGAAAS